MSMAHIRKPTVFYNRKTQTRFLKDSYSLSGTNKLILLILELVYFCPILYFPKLFLTKVLSYIL